MHFKTFLATRETKFLQMFNGHTISLHGREGLVLEAWKKTFLRYHEAVSALSASSVGNASNTVNTSLTDAGTTIVLRDSWELTNGQKH